MTYFEMFGSNQVLMVIECDFMKVNFTKITCYLCTARVMSLIMI